jgi:hypothetical protein
MLTIGTSTVSLRVIMATKNDRSIPQCEKLQKFSKKVRWSEYTQSANTLVVRAQRRITLRQSAKARWFNSLQSIGSKP